MLDNLNLKKFYKNFLTNKTTTQDLFTADPKRQSTFTINSLDCHIDFSKNWVNNTSMNLLYKLADQCELQNKIANLFDGEKINITEDRAVLHTALRNVLSNTNASTNIEHKDQNNPTLEKVYSSISATRNKIEHLTIEINEFKLLGFSGKPINTIVNIGVGGSDLGPKMVYTALRPYWNKKIKCHFVSNIDPSHINNVLEIANPETTLFIVASKSFTTAETLTNATVARNWLLQFCNLLDVQKHFIAVTNKPDKAVAFGINQNKILPIWDWVGGRYSLWSAIGLIISMGTSYAVYTSLLNGASDLDQHFRTKAWSQNMPVVLALLGIGYINYANCQSHAILSYCQNLEYFANYMQQLDMESNGKSIDRENNFIKYKTGPIIWGAIGTDSQHAFFQLLHQGTHIIPCDFIVPILPSTNSTHYANYEEQQQKLIANAFAQTKTLMDGYTPNANAGAAKYKYLSGNKPSTTILLPRLTPYYLGLLIALYEHKVFTQGVIWNINSFDQWGVERGKMIAADIGLNLNHKNLTDLKADQSTINLIKQYQKITNNSDLI